MNMRYFNLRIVWTVRYNVRCYTHRGHFRYHNIFSSSDNCNWLWCWCHICIQWLWLCCICSSSGGGDVGRGHSCQSTAVQTIAFVFWIPFNDRWCYWASAWRSTAIVQSGRLSGCAALSRWSITLLCRRCSRCTIRSNLIITGGRWFCDHFLMCIGGGYFGDAALFDLGWVRKKGKQSENGTQMVICQFFSCILHKCMCRAVHRSALIQRIPDDRDTSIFCIATVVSFPSLKHTVSYTPRLWKPYIWRRPHIK